jgi:hypothetical protein
MTLHFEREARRLAQITMPARIAALSNDEFEGYASLFGVPDSAGDVVQAGAFAASLKTRGPVKVRMLYQHFAHEPIGVWQIIREDARGLYVRGRLVTDTQRGRECLALLAQGALNGLSIGFRTVRAKRDAKTGLRHLVEIELWEISVVTFPLLAQSQVTAVGSADDAADEIRRAASALRSSRIANGE